MILELLRKDGKVVEVQIDDEDYDRISDYSWNACYNKNIKNYYITHSYKENGKSKNLFLHRLIMNCPEGMVVDHINHDTTDNRKQNLRIVTQKENMQNLKIQYKKMSKEIVEEILLSDKTNKELSLKYNVTLANIHNVRCGIVGNYIRTDIERHIPKYNIKTKISKIKNKSNINMLDLDGNILNRFNNKKEVIIYLNNMLNNNGEKKQLQRALNKETNYAYGYKWEYVS